MVIIHKYHLDNKTNPKFFYIRSKEIIHCPYCENQLKVIGSRKRGIIECNGDKRMLVIRRLRCLGCKRVHHELPDIIVPYKRYSSEAIELIISSANAQTDDYPCEYSTAIRIKTWFYQLREYIKNTLISLRFIYNHDIELCNDIDSLLKSQEYNSGITGWLKKLVRFLVNSGRWLHTRSA
jgi:uncharacterized protein YbaR (Trm112 family)